MTRLENGCLAMINNQLERLKSFLKGVQIQVCKALRLTQKDSQL